MDHKEAIRLQAAEKYVLGELPVELREAYEEHYFECAECALEVKAAAAFIDTSREELQRDAYVVAQAPEKAVSKSREKAPGGWFFWLRPAFAVPALAVLLGIVGYQNLVTLPHWKGVARQAAAPRVLLPISLIAGNTRGSELPTAQVRPDEALGLYVDVPTDPAYQQYELRLEDPAGNSKSMRTVSYAEAQKTVVVEFAPGTIAGTYQIVVIGLPTPVSAKPTALANLRFNVEFIK